MPQAKLNTSIPTNQCRLSYQDHIILFLHNIYMILNDALGCLDTCCPLPLHFARLDAVTTCLKVVRNFPRLACFNVYTDYVTLIIIAQSHVQIKTFTPG